MSLIEVKCEQLRKRHALLKEQYREANDQRDGTLDAGYRATLDAQIARIEAREMAAVGREQEELWLCQAQRTDKPRAGSSSEISVTRVRTAYESFSLRKNDFRR